jgi:tRNA/tmRNA/rRNA uracil-C5-methylase (TrmA/RlmC/RlmD family)
MQRIPRNFTPVPYAYHQEIELKIDTLTNLGVGLGCVNGWVVMVPMALPGEKIRARIWRNKSNFSDADLVEVLEKAPERIEPRCKLFGLCGGCQYQQMTYAAQLYWKRRQVQELVTRLAKLDVEVEPTIASPLEFGYRSKITPHYEPTYDGRPMAIGFLGMSTRATIDVKQCSIASEAINAALPAEREKVLVKERAGLLENGGTMLLRDTGHGIETDMSAVAETVVGSLKFKFPAGEFFQNNEHILPTLLDYVIAQAASPGIEYLVDTYCGAGSFAISAASKFTKVAGVEINERSIALAGANAAANGISNCAFLSGSAEAIFSKVEFDPKKSAVVIDPPRAGCDKVFLDQLIKFAPARVVYVSCSPDTQARDLRYLADNGFKVERVQPFDLFPQTRHIESVVTIVPNPV